MKTDLEVDGLMNQIPAEWRNRWCGGERGPCACMGCVQIGNRAMMAKEMTGHRYMGDPEYIDERKIAPEVFSRLKISREEWEAWKSRTAPTP